MSNAIPGADAPRGLSGLPTSSITTSSPDGGRYTVGGVGTGVALLGGTGGPEENREGRFPLRPGVGVISGVLLAGVPSPSLGVTGGTRRAISLALSFTSTTPGV